MNEITERWVERWAPSYLAKCLFTKPLFWSWKSKQNKNSPGNGNWKLLKVICWMEGLMGMVET